MNAPVSFGGTLAIRLGKRRHIGVAHLTSTFASMLTSLREAKGRRLNQIGAKVLAIVFRDTPVRREVSRSGTGCRLCHQRIMLKDGMSSTPVSRPEQTGIALTHEANLNGKTDPFRGQFSGRINIWVSIAAIHRSDDGIYRHRRSL